MHIVLLWQKVVDSDLLMMLMVINGTFYGMPSIPSVVGKREIPSHKLRLLAVNTRPTFFRQNAAFSSFAAEEKLEDTIV